MIKLAVFVMAIGLAPELGLAADESCLGPLTRNSEHNRAQIADFKAHLRLVGRLQAKVEDLIRYSRGLHETLNSLNGELLLLRELFELKIGREEEWSFDPYERILPIAAEMRERITQLEKTVTMLHELHAPLPFGYKAREALAFDDWSMPLTSHDLGMNEPIRRNVMPVLPLNEVEFYQAHKMMGWPGGLTK
jgi:hypothetical protein